MPKTSAELRREADRKDATAALRDAITHLRDGNFDAAGELIASAQAFVSSHVTAKAEAAKPAAAE